MKYDGYRIVAYVEGGRARLVTRNGNDYTRHFPAIARSLEDWAAGRAMVLDGELVVTDEAGKTDFQALQNFLRDPSGKHPAYVAFDLLAFEGDDLRDRPLAERKELLESLMSDAPDNLRATACTCAATVRTASAPPASSISKAWWASGPIRRTAAFATETGSS